MGSWAVHDPRQCFSPLQRRRRVGNRGNSAFEHAPNWVMVMAQPGAAKKWGISFRGMFSLDRFSEGGGYPLLFQTGETWERRIPGRQAASPRPGFRTVARERLVAWPGHALFFSYFGFPGEPARLSRLHAPALAHGEVCPRRAARASFAGFDPHHIRKIDGRSALQIVQAGGCPSSPAGNLTRTASLSTGPFRSWAIRLSMNITLNAVDQATAGRTAGSRAATPPIAG